MSCLHCCDVATTVQFVLFQRAMLLLHSNAVVSTNHPMRLPAGSRSSPLALAVAHHPRARLNVCIDERSLAFWALGYGRAKGLPAAVITSSGTAVANLLPAVVEASLSHVPMIMLTADRPTELRDTGANQTIDQVSGGKQSMFGHSRPFHSLHLHMYYLPAFWYSCQTQALP